MEEFYVGEIRMFGGDYAPAGWALCNGQELPIAEYEVLFALIGTTYGGDGQSTFALPDLRGRIPVHRGTNPVTGTKYDLSTKAGAETVTLSLPQLPAHTHSVHASKLQGDSNTPLNQVWSQSAKVFSTAAEGSSALMDANSLSIAGGNQPHDNMMPSLAITFIIAVTGLYPPKS